MLHKCLNPEFQIGSRFEISMPKRVNLFIGEPNTGKTNILEALAVFSEGVHGPSEFQGNLQVSEVSPISLLITK